MGRAASSGAQLLKRASSLAGEHTVYLYLAFALVTHAIFFAAGISAVGYVYSCNMNYVGCADILFGPEVTGVQLWLAGAVLCPMSLGLVYIATAQLRHRLGRALATTVAATLTSVSFCFALWCMMGLVHPENTFNQGSLKPDTLRQFLGGLGFAVYIPMTCVGACITALLYRGRAGPSSTASSSTGNEEGSEGPGYGLLGGRQKKGGALRAHQPESFARNWKGIVGGLLTLFCCSLAASLLSGVWNYSSPSYFPATSTYSLIQTSWILGPPPSAADANNGWIQPVIVPKVYEDVVIYFTVVGSWIVLGAIASYSPPVRRWAHRTFPIPKPLRVLFPLQPHGISRGEGFILATFTGLLCWWFWYWSTGYPRIRNEAVSEGDEYADLHVYARVMGHMTTLGMSFLTFPVARNSVWEAAFGIPFDRAVAYHRALGRYTWLAVTSHALLWWIKWAKEGTLANNVVTTTSLAISNPPTCGDGNCVHADNFTIPIVEFAWLTLTISLVFAQFMRRRNYELFQYTHIAALLFMVAALVHAWSHWYYTAAGLALLVFDKLTRTVKAVAGSGANARVIHLSHADSVTKIVLDGRCLGSAAVSKDGAPHAVHFAGQYLWLNIPALSPFQWHPFTISSSPALAAGMGTSALAQPGTLAGRPGTIELSVKDMGEGTWSGQLAALATAWKKQQSGGKGGVKGQQQQKEKDEAVSDPRDLMLSVDGPYGRAGHYYDHAVLVLVAGGIGFTPIHSILQDLLLRATAACEAGQPLYSPYKSNPNHMPLGHVRRVHVVWSLRDEALLDAFGATLLGVARAAKRFPELDGLFSLHIHLTSGGNKERAGKGSFKVQGSSKMGGAGFAKLLEEDEEMDEEQAAADASYTAPEAAGWITANARPALHALAASGRPDIAGIFAEAAKEGQKRAHAHGLDPTTQALSSFVCGPHSLVEAVAEQAEEHGGSFHREIFHF